MDNIVLALDPSGNFTEGKGTTGWCMSRDGYIYSAGQIYAAEYKTQMEYWTAVITMIRDLSKEKHESLTVVCEDYRLYASASEAQINSNLETPQMIGAIKWFCHMNDIPITLQMAAEVKKRWSNEVMMNKGMLSQDYRTHKYRLGNLYLNNHSLDAVRHCLHYNTFKAKTRDEKPDKRRTIKSYHSYNRRYSYYD